MCPSPCRFFTESTHTAFCRCRTELLCLTLKQPGGLLACAHISHASSPKLGNCSAIANASSALPAQQHLGGATGPRSCAASQHITPQPVCSHFIACRYTDSFCQSKFPQVRQEMFIFGMWSLLVTAAFMPALSYGTSRQDVLMSNSSSRLLLADVQGGANHAFGSSR